MLLKRMQNIWKRDAYMNEIIKKQKAIFNLSQSTNIDKEAICSCYYRGNLAVTSMGPISPMTAVEPKVVELIIRMRRICQC